MYWVFYHLDLATFIARTNTVLNMVVIVKHTATSFANILNSVAVAYDVT